jgi:hypothetical protein
MIRVFMRHRSAQRPVAFNRCMVAVERRRNPDSMKIDICWARAKPLAIRQYRRTDVVIGRAVPTQGRHRNVSLLHALNDIV